MTVVRNKFYDSDSVYEILTEQIKKIESILKVNKILDYETFIKNQQIRDVLFMKYILFKESLNRANASSWTILYKIDMKKYSWFESEYLDRQGIVHYDCAWNFILNLKSFKKQLIRIKSKGDESRKVTTGLKCSFCGASQNKTWRLIAGPEVNICAECIELCGEILAEERENEAKAKEGPQP